MVLTEAFAAGTPVLASNIAGYADVVSDGHDGVLVPPADPQRLAEELQELSGSRERLARMAVAARESAQRYAWPRVAGEVEAVYERALAVPEAARRPATGSRAGIGVTPSDGKPPVRARRLPSLDPEPARDGDRHRTARRVGRRRRRAARRRAHLHRRAPDRRRPGGDQHRALRRHLGAGRDRR